MENNLRNYLRGISLVLFVMFLFLVFSGNFIQAKELSNESKEAKGLLEKAETCFSEMEERGIPVNRANESLVQAKDLYDTKTKSEERGGEEDYSLVKKYAREVCEVKEVSFDADDQLGVFMTSYNETKEKTDLSELQGTLEELHSSYEDERFEETLELIDQAYAEMSDIEAQQTTVNLFYESTKDTLASFFEENWKGILITTGIVIASLIVFWRTLKQIRLRMKLRTLYSQKESLNHLIQELQRDYFKKAIVSEREFNIKMENYKKMIREIQRRIPSLKEEIHKTESKKKSKKK